MGFQQTQASTGETSPDFWLPSTVITESLAPKITRSKPLSYLHFVAPRLENRDFLDPPTRFMVQTGGFLNPPPVWLKKIWKHVEFGSLNSQPFEVENSQKICCVRSIRSQVSRNFSLAPYHPCHQTLLCTRTAVAPQKHPGSQNMASISSIKARECTFRTPTFRFNIFEKNTNMCIYI